jgi:RHS repeat-associated protein
VAALLWAASYTAWADIDLLHAAAVDNPIRLQGQYADAETGLSYNRHRYFCPHAGQFISQDPLGLSAGIHPYQMAPSSLGWLDPLGLSCIPTNKLKKNANEAAKRTPMRVFWSGGDEARLAAEAFAKANGATTLEMTAAGQRLQQITKGMDWADAKPLWEAASREFAEGATETVHVFQSGTRGVSLQSVWRNVEYPILQKNGINIIYSVTTPVGPIRIP